MCVWKCSKSCNSILCACFQDFKKTEPLYYLRMNTNWTFSSTHAQLFVFISEVTAVSISTYGTRVSLVLFPGSSWMGPWKWGYKHHLKWQPIAVSVQSRYYMWNSVVYSLLEAIIAVITYICLHAAIHRFETVDCTALKIWQLSTCLQ